MLARGSLLLNALQARTEQRNRVLFSTGAQLVTIGARQTSS